MFERGMIEQVVLLSSSVYNVVDISSLGYVWTMGVTSFSPGMGK